MTTTILNRYEAAAALHVGAQARALELIGVGKRVCELGPATGYMSAAIFGQGNELVAGVEIDHEAAAKAQRWFRALYIRDLDTIAEDARLPIHSIDVLVACDVLEHLKEPESVLRHARDWMAPGGYCIASIPNVAHGSVRLALLAGRWRYSETGLLDRSHLRFYDMEGIIRLFDEGGWAIEGIWPVSKPIEISEVEWPQDNPEFARIADVLEQDPHALAYQYVVKAVVA